MMFKLFNENDITKAEGIPVVCQTIANMLANLAYEKDQKLPELEKLINLRIDFSEELGRISNYMFAQMVDGQITYVE